MDQKKPRILVVFHSSNLYSGATRSLTDIMNYLLATEKYHIDVVFPDEQGSALDYYREKGVAVYSFRYGKLTRCAT